MVEGVADDDGRVGVHRAARTTCARCARSGRAARSGPRAGRWSSDASCSAARASPRLLELRPAHRRAGRDHRGAAVAAPRRRRRGLGQDRDHGRARGLADRQRAGRAAPGARADLHAQGRRGAGDRVRLRLRRLLRAMPAAGSLPPSGRRRTTGRVERAVAGRGDRQRARPRPPDGVHLQRLRRVPGGRPRAAARHRADVAPARRGGQWQLAHEVVESWDGRPRHRGRDVDAGRGGAAAGRCAARSTCVDPAEAAVGDRGPRRGDPRAPRRAGARRVPTPTSPPSCGRSASARGCSTVVEAYHRRKRDSPTRSTSATRCAIAARLAREVEAVGRTERSRYRVVLLDEYQDTSHAQLELLSALFGGGHPVTAVGDPHQSIYGWRGASAGGPRALPRPLPGDGRRAPRARPRPVPVHVVAQRPRDPRRREPRRRTAARGRRGVGPASSVPRLEARPARRRRDRADRLPGDGRGGGGRDRPVRRRALATGRAGRRAGDRGACCAGKRSQFHAVENALRAAGLPVEVVGLGGLLQHAGGRRPGVGAAGAARPVPRRRPGAAAHRRPRPARDRRPARARAVGGELAGAQARDARRGAGPASPAAAAAALDDEATVVVEGDVVDERSIVDALDDLPPRGLAQPDRRGRSATPRRERLDGPGPAAADPALAHLPVAARAGRRGRAAAGLDIEVAARPGARAPAAARAHLDAFSDVAAGFSDAGRRADPRRLPRLARRRGARGARRSSVRCTEPRPGRRPAHHRARRQGPGVGRRRGRGPGRRRPAGDRDERAAAGRPRAAGSTGLGRAARTRCAATPTSCRCCRSRPRWTRRRWTSLRKEFTPGRRRARGGRGAPAGLRGAHPGPVGAAAQRLVVARPQGPAAAVAVPRRARARRAGPRPRGGPASRGPARRTRARPSR